MSGVFGSAEGSLCCTMRRLEAALRTSHVGDRAAYRLSIVGLQEYPVARSESHPCPQSQGEKIIVAIEELLPVLTSTLASIAYWGTRLIYRTLLLCAHQNRCLVAFFAPMLAVLLAKFYRLADIVIESGLEILNVNNISKTRD